MERIEVVNAETENVDKLAPFREVAAAEQADKADRSRMSDAAKAKLRLLNEHDRANVEADARLVVEFTSHEWTVEQLTDLFAKAFSSFPRRRAIKAAYRIEHGARIYHIHDLIILGELLPGENDIPMNRFLAKYPLPENETVTPVAGVTGGRPQKPAKVRPCQSGAKCMWLKRGKPAPARKGSLYCTPNCQKSDSARRGREKRTTASTAMEVPAAA